MAGGIASESEHPVIGFFHHMRSLAKQRRREMKIDPVQLERLRRRAAWNRHFNALAERDAYERDAEG